MWRGTKGRKVPIVHNSPKMQESEPVLAEDGQNAGGRYGDGLLAVGQTRLVLAVTSFIY